MLFFSSYFFKAFTQLIQGLSRLLLTCHSVGHLWLIISLSYIVFTSPSCTILRVLLIANSHRPTRRNTTVDRVASRRRRAAWREWLFQTCSDSRGLLPIQFTLPDETRLIGLLHQLSPKFLHDVAAPSLLLMPLCRQRYSYSLLWNASAKTEWGINQYSSFIP